MEENETEQIYDPEFTDGTFEGTSFSDSDSEAESERKGGKKGGFIFLIIVIVIAVLAAAYGILVRMGVLPGIGFGGKSGMTPPISAPSRQHKNNFPLNISIGNFRLGNNRAPARAGEKYVARLYITGVIQQENESYNQAWLLDTIETLQDDSDNVGIILVIDSPGGTVYEADEAYLALRKYKESGKTVWAYFKAMAASGAYYIACAADSIYANRNTLAGSIGVICGSSVDATEFLSKMGIKVKTFHAGRNKTMLSFDEPLTEEQEAIMQSLADECYEQFTGIVASARQKSIDEIKVLADGRIYTAKQAKENGLVDQIGTLENAENRMRNALSALPALDGIDADDIAFYDYEYIYEPPFMNRFMGIISNAAKPSSLVGDPLTRAAIESLGPDISYPAYLYRR